MRVSALVGNGHVMMGDQEDNTELDSKAQGVGGDSIISKKL